MDLTDVVQNPHFQYLVALLRLPLCFVEWHRKYLSDDIEILMAQAMPHLTSEDSNQEARTASSILPIQALIEAIVKADSRLNYRSEAMHWLTDLFERFPLATEIVLGMLFAAAYTMPEMMTTVQLAEIRQEPEITWRKRAQAGEIPGAYKAGNRWLLPCSTLQIQGFLPDERTGEEVSLSRYERVISFVHPSDGSQYDVVRHAASSRLEASGGKDTSPAP